MSTVRNCSPSRGPRSIRFPKARLRRDNSKSWTLTSAENGLPKESRAGIICRDSARAAANFDRAHREGLEAFDRRHYNLSGLIRSDPSDIGAIRMSTPSQVTVWGEFRHEKKNPKVSEIYPQGMHETIAAFLRKEPGLEVRTATLDQPEHGLTEAVLDSTDVLVWWGHMAHGDVSDEIVERVKRRVLEGMGLIVLHSGHYAKIFKAL